MLLLLPLHRHRRLWYQQQMRQQTQARRARLARVHCWSARGWRR
jgi:hypothetical protein